MPELPEVETIRRDLRPLLRGRSIRAARLCPGVNGDIWKFLWAPRPPREDALEGPLVGARIVDLERRGKYLVLRLQRRGAPAGRLVVHLGMTGRLTVERGAGPAPKHLRLEVVLEGGDRLRFVDPRRFGRVGFWPEAQEPAPLAALARVEPIDPEWDAAYLADICGRHARAPIKAVLLDQGAVAGLGNIYTDEALWAARIHPARPAGTLTPKDLTALARTARDALERGIRNRGTSVSDYVDGRGRSGRNQLALRAYGRAGLPCGRCRAAMVASRVAGRGTTHCPRCQLVPARSKARTSTNGRRSGS